MLEEEPTADPTREIATLRGDAERLRRMQLVTFALAEALAPAQVGDVLVREGAAATGAAAVTVYLYDDTRTELSMLASTGLSAGQVEKWRTIRGDLETPIAFAARTLQPVLLASREEWGRWKAQFPGGPEPNPISAAWAAIPLVVKGRSIGVFALSFTAPRTFEDSDVELMTAMAGQCAQAFDRARLYAAESAARAAAELHAERIVRLQATTAALGRALHPAAVADVILTAAVDHLGARSGFVAQCSPDGTQVEFLANVGGGPDFVERWATISRSLGQAPEQIGGRTLFDFSLLQTPFPIALRTRTPVWVEELGEWDGGAGMTPALIGMGGGGTACIPLVARGALVGGIRLTFEGKRTFADDEKTFILALAEQAAQAMDRARLYEAERRAAGDRAFLAEVSALAAESLDWTVVERIVELTVPRFADHCNVSAYEAGQFCSLATASTDGEGAKAFAELIRAWRFDAEDEAAPATALLRLQHAFRITDYVVRDHASKGQPPEFYELMTQLAPRSLMLAPVVIRGELYGLIAFVSTTRNFDADDQSVAEELARRTGIAIDNARLYARAVADRDVAERARGMRDEFLSIVAHDLGNPLNAVGLWADVVFRAAPPGVEGEAAREGVSRIKDGVRRMNALLHDLLDVASIDAGRLGMVESRRETPSLVKEALELLAPLAAEKGIRLVAEIDDAVEGTMVSCDANRIQQVFGNLLDNAIKFTPSGGSITVAAELAGREVRFRVTDTGPGISAEACTHIFDRFWQAAQRDLKKGVGLGLFIAKGIVEAHRGKLWVESVVGRGTTFFFTLPAA